MVSNTLKYHEEPGGGWDENSPNSLTVLWGAYLTHLRILVISKVQISR
jgi:hypothetical protein